MFKAVKEFDTIAETIEFYSTCSGAETNEYDEYKEFELQTVIDKG